MAVHQPLIGIQPTLTTTMLYPAKESAWHTVATEIPKESIIANTDFTTTSLIAKRRLSSKKRRKLEGCSTEADSSSRSPTDSTGSNASPALVSSTTGMERSERADCPTTYTTHQLTHAFSLPHTSTVTHPTLHHPHTSTVTHPTLHHPHGHTHHIAAAGTGISVLAGQQYVSVAPGACYPVPIPGTVGVVPKQFVNPALNRLHQELNYRFLQEQSSGPAPVGQVTDGQTAHQSTLVHDTRGGQGSEISMEVAPTLREGSGERAVPGCLGPAGFKWCSAHIYIARKIRQDQEQDRGRKVLAHSSALAMSESSKEHHRTSHPLPHPHPPNTLNSASQADALQQQLLMLQMYGGLPPGMAVPGGYLAVPYSVPEMQLQMQPFVPAAAAPAVRATPPQLAGRAGLSLVKPMANHVAGCGGGDLSTNSVHLVGGVPLQAGPYGQPVSLAAVAPGPSDVGAVMLPGNSGSWVGTVPVIGSCVINNPFQPGIMAAPWVK